MTHSHGIFLATTTTRAASMIDQLGLQGSTASPAAVMADAGPRAWVFVLMRVRYICMLQLHYALS